MATFLASLRRGQVRADCSRLGWWIIQRPPQSSLTVESGCRSIPERCRSRDSPSRSQCRNCCLLSERNFLTARRPQVGKRFPQAQPHAGTGHVSQGRCPEASRMPRPMMILAGERQLGQLNVPELRANIPLGVAPSAGVRRFDTLGPDEPIGGTKRQRGGTTSKGARMASIRTWLAALSIGAVLATASCGGSTASATASRNLGVLLGVADQCSGLPKGPSHPVQVIVYRNGRVVVRQTKMGSHNFKFSLPAGRYRVTTNQSYAVPVTVKLRPGEVAHASVESACD